MNCNSFILLLVIKVLMIYSICSCTAWQQVVLDFLSVFVRRSSCRWRIFGMDCRRALSKRCWNTLVRSKKLFKNSFAAISSENFLAQINKIFVREIVATVLHGLQSRSCSFSFLSCWNFRWWRCYFAQFFLRSEISETLMIVFDV